ncbi:MAG: hypothetical protein ACO1OQ_16575 [Rufibacter sp.]
MNFIRGLGLTTVLVVLAVSVLVFLAGDRLVHPYIWWLVGFFVFITGFSHYVATLGVKHDPEHFSAFYYASMGVRMVFCIIAIFVYRYFHEERLIQFVFNFFALYFVFTAFEIYALLSNLRRNSKKPY